MFVDNSFKEDFDIDELDGVWETLTNKLDNSIIKDFQLVIWYEVNGKVRESTFTYKITELDKAFERIKRSLKRPIVKILKFELIPRLKSVFINI